LESTGRAVEAASAEVSRAAAESTAPGRTVGMKGVPVTLVFGLTVMFVSLP
jgi:hypothetical protein